MGIILMLHIGFAVIGRNKLKLDKMSDKKDFAQEAEEFGFNGLGTSWSDSRIP